MDTSNYTRSKVREQSFADAFFSASAYATPLLLSVLVTGDGELLLGTLVHAEGSMRQGGLLIFPKDAFTGAMLANGSRSDSIGTVCEDRILAMVDERGVHPTDRTNLTFSEAVFLGKNHQHYKADLLTRNPYKPDDADTSFKIVQQPVQPGRRRKG